MTPRRFVRSLSRSPNKGFVNARLSKGKLMDEVQQWNENGWYADLPWRIIPSAGRPGMVQTLSKNRWLPALCGGLYSIVSLIFVSIIRGMDGPMTFHA